MALEVIVPGCDTGAAATAGGANPSMVITLTTQVSLTANGRRRHRCYKLTALDHYREPLAGVLVGIALVDEFGAFDLGNPRQRHLEVLTNGDGEAVFDWFEFPLDADLSHPSAELSLSCLDQRAIDVTLEPHIEMPWI